MYPSEDNETLEFLAQNKSMNELHNFCYNILISVDLYEMSDDMQYPLEQISMFYIFCCSASYYDLCTTLRMIATVYQTVLQYDCSY